MTKYDAMRKGCNPFRKRMTDDERVKLAEQSFLSIENNVGFYRGVLCQVRDGKPVAMNMLEYMKWIHGDEWEEPENDIGRRKTMIEPLFDLDNPTQLGLGMVTMEAILMPIREQDRAAIRKKAAELKQSDGESWAIGEMVERACIMLDALETAN